MTDPEHGPTDASTPAAFQPVRSLRAFRLTTSFSAATVLVGVVSAKLLATFGGQEAMALASVFRNISVLVSRVLMLGNDSLALSHIASASTDQARRRVVRATALLFVVQIGLIALLGGALALLPPGVQFHDISAANHLPALWVTLVMTVISMALQLVVTVLNAVGDIRRAGQALLAAGAATALLTYPLLQFGEVGIAMTVGTGSIVGLLLGLRFIRSRHPALLSGPSDPTAGPLLRLQSVSAPLMLQPLIYMSGTLYGQGAIASEYTVKGLGSFAAATMLIDTAAFVLMSGARNHVLPTLARAQRREDKTSFLTYAFTYFSGVATLAGLGLIVAAPLASRILFGASFSSASGIIAAMALCLPAQAMSYTAAAVLNSSKRFWLCVVGDICSTTGFVTATLACVHWHADLASTGLAYTAGHVTGAVVYILLVAFADGSVKVEGRPLRMALACTVASVTVLLATRWSLPLGIALGLGAGALLLRQVLALRAHAPGAPS